MRIRRTAAALVLTAGLFAPSGAVIAAPEGAADRAEVQATFLDEVVPVLETPIGWTGDAATCDSGEPSTAAQAATLTTINYVRGLSGLDPVSFDPALSAKAQEAALMMHANDDLDHEPPSSWRCWTQDGFEGAGSSNIALGIAGAPAILAYMQDDGGGNTAVGHRRWILRPATATMGSGSTSRANALWIFGEDAAGATTPEWIPWPVAGYFPSPLEPAGRWSIGASNDEVTFSNATVAVTGPGGEALSVRTYPEETGFGPNTLVWEVEGVTLPRDDEPDTYHVVVSGISGSSSTSYEYDVHLFSPPLAIEVPPAITGRARVGRTLRVSPGRWAPEPDQLRYQWLRAGTEVAGATSASYLLTRRDKGKTISLVVTARRLGFADETATTDPTRPVRPRAS